MKINPGSLGNVLAIIVLVLAMLFAIGLLPLLLKALFVLLAIKWLV